MHVVDYELTITDEAQTAEDRTLQGALRGRGHVPEHIAIIMDGNGRWARKRGLPRLYGHREGVASAKDIMGACAQLGVSYLTLYTFSLENWERPAREVDALMTLLLRTIRRERKTLEKNNIQLQVIGDVSRLPRKMRNELEEIIDATASNTGMTLVLALSYSGRWEIVEAVRKLARRVRDGKLEPDAITEGLVSQALGTDGIPDPDLLIRTGGEYRVSNFLLWQMAYTEIVITEGYWPVFRREQLYGAIRCYQDRDRRFGRIQTSVYSPLIHHLDEMPDDQN